MSQRHAQLLCSQCRTPTIIYDTENGEHICTTCGVIDTSSGHSHEYEDQSAGSQGTPQTKAQSSILITGNTSATASMTKNNRDHSGSFLSTEMRRLQSRLTSLNMANYEERNTQAAKVMFEKIGDKMGIPRIYIERGIVLYTQMRTHLKNRNLEVSVVAVLYAVCRENSIPITLDDFVNLTHVRKKSLTKVYRLLLLNNDNSEGGSRVQVQTAQQPERFISKICNRFEETHGTKIKETTQRRALNLVNTLDATEKRGISSTALATGAIYAICAAEKYNLRQKDIATAGQISEVTLRKHRNLFESKLQAAAVVAENDDDIKTTTSTKPKTKDKITNK